MPIKRCPVCLKLKTVGYGKKTCGSECGRAWTKMSNSEQEARLRSVDEDSRVEDLKAQLFHNLPPVNSTTQSKQFVPNVEQIDPDVMAEMNKDAEREARFDRRLVDPSLFMPKGIIPEEDEPKLPLNPSDNRTKTSEDDKN